MLLDCLKSPQTIKVSMHYKNTVVKMCLLFTLKGMECLMVVIISSLHEGRFRMLYTTSKIRMNCNNLKKLLDCCTTKFYESLNDQLLKKSQHNILSYLRKEICIKIVMKIVIIPPMGAAKLLDTPSAHAQANMSTFLASF